jgi:hypothetical protein
MRARPAPPPGPALGAPGVLLAFALLVPIAACQGLGPAPGGPDVRGLLKRGETLVLFRNVAAAPAPGTPGAASAVPEFTVVVVKQADGKLELRVGEHRPRGAAQVHASRPGDEFRNLAIEDVNSDGRPEIVSTWLGGQLEIVEVLGRSDDGAWKPILQNAGQIIEERRLSDRSTAFWITSRTYEEESGQPPIFETVVYRWDGSAFNAVHTP